MKNPINWKLFFILLVATWITSAMVLPYALALSPQLASLLSPIFILAQLVQALVIFSLVIYIGLRLAKRTGFGLPILEKYLNDEKVTGDIKSILGVSIGWGVLSGILIILASLLFSSVAVDLLQAEIAIPTWKSFLASFYGGVAEEVVCRLFLMNLLVWLSMKIKTTLDGRPTTAGIWLAIVLSSIIFGLGHLPITGAVTAITPAIVARAILLNGIPGVILGWLYQKKGLESAMIAHFSADIVIHVIMPLIVVMFI